MPSGAVPEECTAREDDKMNRTETSKAFGSMHDFITTT